MRIGDVGNGPPNCDDFAMDLFNALAPGHPVLFPMAFAIVLYGGRYLLLALVFFGIAAAQRGRAHASAPVRRPLAPDVRRELGWSMVTVLVFGAVYAAFYGWGWAGHSLLYWRLDAYPDWWFWLCVPVMLVLHDTLFYWLHRAMHSRALYARMHRTHHRSVHPTAFAAYSFHPAEALMEALIVTAILYIVPVHPLHLLVFQTLSTAYNVYGHCGREFFPEGMATHWLGRWINTSSTHAAHHAQGRHNYGFYFMAWDRWMKTVDPAQR